MPSKTISNLILFLFVAFNINAQEKNKDTEKKNIIIRIQPSSFADIDPGFKFGAEYKLNDNLSVISDFSFLSSKRRASNTFFSNTSNKRNMLGFAIFPELRYYTNTKNDKTKTIRRLFRAPYVVKKNKNNFVSFQLGYKKTNDRFSSWIVKSDPVSGAFYQELINFDEIKNVFFINILFGTKLFLDDAEKLAIEPYLGFGARFKKFNFKNFSDISQKETIFREFENRNNRRFFLIGDLYNNGVFVSVPFGFKLSYNL